MTQCWSHKGKWSKVHSKRGKAKAHCAISNIKTVFKKPYTHKDSTNTGIQYTPPFPLPDVRFVIWDVVTGASHRFALETNGDETCNRLMYASVSPGSLCHD